ncbi:MAG TPA: nucleotidyltransferase domain-containing protein [Aggregatilineaceae bacterium]|nr:nucleotidyltransferase domain-containing protein [Aggregatilineaceae bacterium]
MLLQAQMIERVRTLCRDDSHLDAAMMYGSFTSGEGDEFSDIEFLLFFEDAAFPALDRRAWLEQIAPVELLFVNEFGVTTAIFANLVRGEFHFHSVSEMTVAQARPGVVSFPSLDSTLIADKSGRLTPYLQPLIGPPPPQAVPEKLQFAAECFVNWWLFGFHVLRRAEQARALELLGTVQRNLLWMARAVQGGTDHWHIPSRLLEQELSSDAYARFKACTASLDALALWSAYRAAWAWGRELIETLRAQHGIDTPERLFADIDSALSSHPG